MSTRSQRRPFQPRVTRGTTAAEVNATFRREREEWQLRWRCRDCVYVVPTTMKCSLAWPNAALLVEDPDVLDSRDVPILCKAFEFNGDPVAL